MPGEAELRRQALFMPGSRAIPPPPAASRPAIGVTRLTASAPTPHRQFPTRPARPVAGASRPALRRGSGRGEPSRTTDSGRLRGKTSSPALVGRSPRGSRGLIPVRASRSTLLRPTVAVGFCPLTLLPSPTVAAAASPPPPVAAPGESSVPDSSSSVPTPHRQSRLLIVSSDSFQPRHRTRGESFRRPSASTRAAPTPSCRGSSCCRRTGSAWGRP